MQAFGDGLTTAVTNSTAHFTVEAKRQGLRASGQLTVGVKSEKGSVNVSVHEEDGGNYAVMYTPTDAGKHEISVLYEGQPITSSPFHAEVTEQSKVQNAIVDGACLSPDSENVTGVPIELSISTATCGAGKLQITATGPGGQDIPAYHRDLADGRTAVRVETPVAGDYTVNVLWSGRPVPKSPFKFCVQDAMSAGQIRVRSALHCFLHAEVTHKHAHTTLGVGRSPNTESNFLQNFFT